MLCFRWIMAEHLLLFWSRRVLWATVVENFCSELFESFSLMLMIRKVNLFWPKNDFNNNFCYHTFSFLFPKYFNIPCFIREKPLLRLFISHTQISLEKFYSEISTEDIFRLPRCSQTTTRDFKNEMPLCFLRLAINRNADILREISNKRIEKVALSMIRKYRLFPFFERKHNNSER